MGKAPFVRVRLHRYADRPIGLIWQYNARSGEVSSGTFDESEAHRAAGRLEAQLASAQLPGRPEGINISWEEFCQRYETEWLEPLSYGSQKGWAVASKRFEEICKPKLLADVDKSMLSRFRGELEQSDLAPASVRSYYRAIRAALGWAESVDLIDQVPRVRQRRQQRSSATMRARTITAEEFDRLLAALLKLRMKHHDAYAFQRFAKGLWYSGLRIDELNRLRWDTKARLHVDLSGKLPLIVFLGAQKNHADSYLPAPPEFWELVDRPGVIRSGPVFPIYGRWSEQMTTRHIGRQISAAGRKAGIVVDPRTGKCASAHDLRAAYISRVAAIATMSQTQALARHSDPKTTSQFYVRHEAETLAQAAGWT